MVFGDDAAVFGFCFGEGFFDIVAIPFSFRASGFVVLLLVGPADGTGFRSVEGGAGGGGFNGGGRLVRGGFGDGEGGIEVPSVVGARRGGADGWCCCEDCRESWGGETGLGFGMGSTRIEIEGDALARLVTWGGRGELTELVP